MKEQTYFQTKQQLIDLLCELVSVPSITGSSAEGEMAKFIHRKFLQLPYFKKYPSYAQLHDTEDGRFIVTAFVKGQKTNKTVILVNHHDVVGVEGYGIWKDAAFNPIELTKRFYGQRELVPFEVRQDLDRGEWLFGRGIMDMKSGMATQMSLIERATNGDFEGNLLFLSVPDEEVSSIGMRRAVPVLLDLAKQHSFQYSLVLNGEPMFSRYPGDTKDYLYVGSIGKVLPGFFCYGKESHVGEPFAGLNANLLVSELARALELNTDYCEVIEGEVSPPPTILSQGDLKKEYSTQTPNRALALYNFLVMKKPMDKFVSSLLESAQQAAREVEKHYNNRAFHYGMMQSSTPKSVNVHVFTYEKLYKYGVDTYGKEHVDNLIKKVQHETSSLDHREQTTAILNELALLCKELSPMIILFFAPPYYPAVCTDDHPLVKKLVQILTKTGAEKYGIAFHKQLYFGGISDLSYVGLNHALETFLPLVHNMPLWKKGYDIPFSDLEQFKVPVFNLGPRGRDAHQWTERLDVNYSFGPLMDLLQMTVKECFK
ncbi:M20/M25/M40 family metallo-hydrolase [Priestia endophytica]|uniref:Arginine utilization protein RocB n=1 Tax=Priestia endophytica DSM 13796 TaxID=1121089 RepID=A0A1I5XN06_9BACI|nr:M20/M25/M40 family metallo-hydrolase [Priestia endophytica]KYG31318.1 hypothetical protein AZF06_06125 [Priestia endophytica]SFQ33329.1 Arginine utilization protein RocB [Priestia endophytica DSM 13796]